MIGSSAGEIRRWRDESAPNRIWLRLNHNQLTMTVRATVVRSPLLSLTVNSAV